MRHTWVMFGLSVVTAACSPPGPRPTSEDYDDTAQAVAMTTGANGSSSAARYRSAVAATSGGDLASMSDVVSLSLGTLPVGLSLMSGGQFDGTRLGIDYSYSLSCATGGLAAPCGPTADQATADITWSGDLTTATINAQVSRDGHWTVSGLQSGTATFNGDSTFTFDATFQSIFRPSASAAFSYDASAAYHAVKVDDQTGHAIDGSVGFSISAMDMVTGSGGSSTKASFEVVAVLTFHSNQLASLTLDGDQHYTLNLNTGVVARANVVSKNGEL